MDNTTSESQQPDPAPTPTRAQTLRAHLDQLRNPPASAIPEKTGEAPTTNQPKKPEPQAQQSQPVIVFYDGSTPLPDERAEGVANLVVSDWTRWRAWKMTYKPDGCADKYAMAQVSVLRKGEDYRKREGWLQANKRKMLQVAQNEQSETAPKPQLIQKVVEMDDDAELLTPALVKKVLKRALNQRDIDAVTMAAVNQAIKMLKMDSPDVGAPDPGAIAAWLATDHTDKAELDEILSELSKLYRVQINGNCDGSCK